MQTTGIQLNTSVPVVLELRRGKVVWLSDGEGMELLCHSGTLWVTQGDVQDIVLHSGETRTVERRRRALIHAMDDSRLTLRPGSQSSGTQNNRRSG